MQSNYEQRKATGPLAGLRVLNIGTSIVGPWAASLLAHLGAVAVKVERPKGEFIRQLRPMQNGLSTCYTASNNDQLSSEMDIKQPEDLAAVQELARQADVLIENFRPGVTERIGLGYETLGELNDGLVYVSSSSWGDVGPMRDLAALDPHVQAFSGFGSLNGPQGGEPEMLRFVHMDPAGSTVVASLALLGLIQRERFGHAGHCLTSHFAMGIAMQMNRAAESLMTGQSAELLGSASSASAPNQCFRMLDQEYIALACDNQAQWRGLCRGVGHNEWIDDERFVDNQARVAHRVELADMLGVVISKKPKRWWVVQFETEKVPHGFSMDFEQIRHHQQVVANELLTTIHAPHMGPIFVAGVPWQFSETPAEIDPVVSAPGEHTGRIKAEGFGDDRPARWKPAKGSAEPPLSGLKVIDATQGYAGPYLGLLLAEAGAEVIKVEPPTGDWARELVPKTESGNSAMFEAFNRNKDIVKINLDDSQGQTEFLSLLKNAALVLEDWGPGIAEQRQLSYDLLKKEHPGLVYFALSPFGEKGPLKDLPGSELVIQAMSGYTRMLGELGAPPVRAGADISATCTGSMAFVGVLAALYHRHRTGRGQRVSTSLLGTMMSLKTNQFAAMSNPDEWLGDSYCTNETDSSHSGYQTKDRPVYFSPSPMLSREDFFKMARELGADKAVMKNPEFDENWWHTIGMGYLARDAKPLWEQCTRELSSQQVMEIFNRYDGIWAVEFTELATLVDHPQVDAIGLVDDVDGQRFMRAPWRVDWDLPELQPVSKR